MLGEAPLQAALENARSLGPDAMRDRVLDRLVMHRASAPAADDVTLLILTRNARG
jgi:serine phosphatase RsbU (regulator of sigma subunit)